MVMMTIQPHSVRSAPPPCALPSTYNDFLYAPVGEDKNGVFLTVLSMLARQNVDPWEEAADLNRLPRDSAKQKLVSMITASSGQPSTPAEFKAVADRVLALLPGCASAVRSRDVSPVSPDTPQPGQPATRARLLIIAIYIGLVFIGQWIAANAFEKPRVDGASTASVPSTLGETLPSTTATDRPVKSSQ
jgi:hypothetical protein